MTKGNSWQFNLSRPDAQGVARILYLREQGLTMAIIAQRMGCSQTMVQTVLAKTKDKP